VKTGFIVSLINLITFAGLIHSAQAQCFLENNGVVAIEAEDFSSQEKTSVREWQVQQNNAISNTASGGKYIQVLPDTRVTHDDPVIRGENFSDVSGQLAVLNYKVNFQSTGKYYVWVRLYSTGSEDNGVHIGINDTWPESGERMQWCDGKRNWTWESKQRTSAEHCGVERQIFINVTSPGEQTFQMSMREDGVRIDKIVLSKAYTKPNGTGPSARQGACAENNDYSLPEVTSNASIAVVADGNSPDPDDIGATAMSLAIMKSFGVSSDLVYYAHSCDLDPFSGSSQTITAQQELNRQELMQTAADGTASRWGGFDHITFYNCRTQEFAARQKLKEAINAATETKPLAIILAGEPDIIYDAVSAANTIQRKFVTIVSHHVANEESADTPGKNISDLENDFPAVTVDRIPDQNVLLKTPIADWNWAKDHDDSRIQWLWEQGKIAEQDPAVGFQHGNFDVSDAGMVYYQITGDKNPDEPKLRALLNHYVDNHSSTPPPNQPPNLPPIVSISTPSKDTTVTEGNSFYLLAEATDDNLDYTYLMIDGDSIRKESVAPYEWGHKTSGPDEEELLLSSGTHEVSIVAVDKQNLRDTASIQVTIEPVEDPVGLQVLNVNSPQISPQIMAVENGYVVETGGASFQLEVLNLHGEILGRYQIQGEALLLGPKDLAIGINILRIKGSSMVKIVNFSLD